MASQGSEPEEWSEMVNESEERRQKSKVQARYPKRYTMLINKNTKAALEKHKTPG